MRRLIRRPPRNDGFPTTVSGRTFLTDSDGFTARDFQTIITSLTWLGSTAWMAWLLVGGNGGASDLHLRFYSSVSQVFMVALGGMAAQQFGSMWFGGGYSSGMGGYGTGMGGYNDPTMGGQSVLTVDQMQTEPGETGLSDPSQGEPTTDGRAGDTDG